MPGAVTAGMVLEFSRDNLWGNLNGAAAIYQDNGCLFMATRDYQMKNAQGGEVELTVKVFAMERPLYAFGLENEALALAAMEQLAESLSQSELLEPAIGDRALGGIDHYEGPTGSTGLACVFYWSSAR